jgi:glycosyltransferase involved in cell wall biosynthesis
MSTNGGPPPDEGNDVTPRPKVLVVFPYRDEYGTLRTLRFVLKSLEAAGCDVVCLLPDGAGAHPHLAGLGVDVRTAGRLGTFPRTFSPVRLASFLRDHLAATRAVAALARGERAALVYTLSEAVFCGSLGARRAGVPSIVHVIGLSIGRPRWVGKAYIGVLRRLTTRFVACSSGVAAMLGRNGVPAGRIAVVPSGVAIAEIDATSGAPSPIETRGPKVGMVAAYDPRKGHELFVAAAARLARLHPDARFYIIGGVLDGQSESLEFEAQIRRQIEESGLGAVVVRVGHVGSGEVYAWIRALDVFILPSRTEAFGYVQYEAMACERPVVATRAGGNLDAFVDGESGLYVDQTADQLAEAAARILADADLAARLAHAARERVVRLFAEEKLIPVLARVVQGTIAGASSRR